MHRLITVSAGRRVAMFLTLGIGLVACTPASSPCGFILDNDVTGSDDGRVLHLKGTLTIKGTAFNC